MLGMVCIDIVRFRAIWFGKVWFGVLYVNVNNLTYFERQIWEENLVLSLSKYDIFPVELCVIH